ncbi:MAG: hypothetical protein PHX83_13960 [Acidobacteriia bacterium]|nr:hypothetical protein [Terriglobia bacterium]
MKRIVLFTLLLGTLWACLCPASKADDERHQTVISSLSSVPTLDASTVPPNGDLNPYGVAFVPREFPNDSPLRPGDILVSNFNNSANMQGTGTTIVAISPQGTTSVFFQGSPGLGLTTALGVLKRGFVLVGNVPTSDGTCGTVQAGSLLILDRNGNLVETLSDPSLLDGPWDLTIREEGENAQVFVSNVLNGTVTRIDLKLPDPDSDHAETGNPVVRSMTQIASGYLHRCDPNALVVGPTGLALDLDHDLLYVASTGDNEIFSIQNPSKVGTQSGQGRLVYQDNVHLHGPLGLVRAPNGDLITTNGDAVNPDSSQPSEMVEFTAQGVFVAQRSVDSSGQGGAFGLALSGPEERLRLAAVDDITNTLEVWVIR